MTIEITLEYKLDHHLNSPTSPINPTMIVQTNRRLKPTIPSNGQLTLIPTSLANKVQLARHKESHDTKIGNRAA